MEPRTHRTLLLVLLALIVIVVAGWLSVRGKARVPTASPVGATLAPPDSDATWPGIDRVRTVDDSGAFSGNLSGLAYESGVNGAEAALWAVRNGPGTLYRLIHRGDVWVPDTAGGWAAGRSLRYSSNAGDVDAEGVTLTSAGASHGVYVAAERNNLAKKVSRNSVLRFATTSTTGAMLRATNEWNLTRDLPPAGANAGIEGITWIPDSILVARGFREDGTGRVYVPTAYANHGMGLFIVGLETNGMIYAYALDHATNGYTRVASIASGLASVMALEYDRESGDLWTSCDDSCGNQSAILGIDTTARSNTLGHFVSRRRFARPPSLPNVNNEGFALAYPCVDGRKSVFWSDDSETGGHSIRTGSLPCGSAKPY